ncbi:MAG TPA: UvrD-helicase domain-containing protein, partial [Kofleriaceae bacterium]|nr:UvrD-helicase domain-containing protein [Kofleriaceae bacterium]
MSRQPSSQHATNRQSSTPDATPHIDLISASAGSGKTYSLTQDLAASVGYGAAPEGCMAITFTNAAAAEIASRIRRTLLERGEWATAQRVLDGYLGTVHAVCGGIIEEFALEAGLSPSLDVVPAAEARLLFNRAIAAIASDEILVERIEGPARRMGIEDWREGVNDIVAEARSNGLDSDAVRACGPRSWSSMQALYESCGELLDGDALDREFTAELEGAIEAIRESGDETKGTASALFELETIATTLRSGHDLKWSDWVRVSKVEPTKKSQPFVEALKTVAAHHVRHPRLRADLEAMITGMFECAARSMEAFARNKADAGLIDFVDQEALALALLGRDDVRAALAERLATAYVDEFQDTSPIQLALMLRLAACARRSVWIGDQKQSIYGFRGADPSLMDAVIEGL